MPRAGRTHGGRAEAPVLTRGGSGTVRFSGLVSVPAVWHVEANGTTVDVLPCPGQATQQGQGWAGWWNGSSGPWRDLRLTSPCSGDPGKIAHPPDPPQHPYPCQQPPGVQSHVTTCERGRRPTPRARETLTAISINVHYSNKDTEMSQALRILVCQLQQQKTLSKYLPSCVWNMVYT